MTASPREARAAITSVTRPGSLIQPEFAKKGRVIFESSLWGEGRGESFQFSVFSFHNLDFS